MKHVDHTRSKNNILTSSPSCDYERAMKQVENVFTFRCFFLYYYLEPHIFRVRFILILSSNPIIQTTTKEV